MELRLQPKPIVEIRPASREIVSRKEYFVRKVYESINQYFFPGHLIRNWRPKAELLYPTVSEEDSIRYECDFNRDVQNCFVEDYAEEVYLRTPPPCFVVIGKFGMNVKKLGQDIANEYGSVLITVDDIIGQVLKTETETARFLDKILRYGVSLGLSFILALLSFMAHTPEARHRGYVLCGLPSIPFPEELSVEKQIDYLFAWDNKPTVFVNVLFEDDDLIQARRTWKYPVLEGTELSFSLNDVVVDKSGDYDLEREEETVEVPRADSVSYDRYNSDFDYISSVSGNNDDTDENIASLCPQEETILSQDDVDVSPSRPTLFLPRDERSRVWNELELFNVIVKPLTDLIKARVDPQYFITVDSRVQNEFEMVKARLNLLQIWKVPIPFPLIPLKEPQNEEKEKTEDEEQEEAEPVVEEKEEIEESEEDAELREIAQEPPQTAFLKLFTKKTISPKFRWELSHYNYTCPVSLRNGELIEGKSEFAVVFLKYIYFLRDRESLAKFIQNPRPYVLPIKPKPPSRYIIIGYPYSGKTEIALSLASTFQIPLIDLDKVLKDDISEKKFIYQEFCRRKAEEREIIRLTAQSWRDWRMEEERRISLIEDWIVYIQRLLSERIKQFYSLKTKIEEERRECDLKSSGEEMLETEGEFERRDSLEVQGTAIVMEAVERRDPDSPSPSVKIIQAMKHEDYDFNDNNFEVEANLFFSAMWKSFSNRTERYHTPNSSISEEYFRGEEELGEEPEDITVDWCHLLPPQSLSSFLLQKVPCTNRERRESFQMLLSAASKAYWAPSPLKSEFAKWNLPCYMDIVLCEIFIKNPLLLIKYCPEWLKERPLIPDPIDPMHPAVTEAGRKAFLQANVVSIQHSKEEVGVLLRIAIEKAERDGLRVTGEVISPGGWVVDNMVLDREVWCELIRENVFADHVYILIDTEPDYKRILNIWYKIHCGTTPKDSEVLAVTETVSTEDMEDDKELEDQGSWDSTEEKVPSLPEVIPQQKSSNNIILLLEQSMKAGFADIAELDEIFQILKRKAITVRESEGKVPLDVFTKNFIQDVTPHIEVKDESPSTTEIMGGMGLGTSSSISFFTIDDLDRLSVNLPLGMELEFFTNAIVNSLNADRKDSQNEIMEQTQDALEFFISLLLLPQRLEKVKEWVTYFARNLKITEIVVTGRTTSEILSDIITDLSKDFLKKPRELEDFEVEEVKKDFDRENAGQKEENEEEAEEEAEEEYEDLRIYGESGPFCIVNLERNILLMGKMEHVLRYYGKLYFFWNEDAKQKFIEDPEKYAPYYSAIRCLPPLRVYVMGVPGSGKTILSTSISNQIGAHHIEYTSFLNSTLVPHLNSKLTKLTAAVTDKKLLLSQLQNEGAALHAKFNKLSYFQRQYWLERLPFFPYESEYQKELIRSLIELNEAPINKDFPEISYECLEEPEKLEEMVLDSTEPAFVSLKEVESNLWKYLHSDGDLDDYSVSRTLQSLWSKIDYATQGFVIDDFPFRLSDIERMTENNWIPDLVIFMNISASEAIENGVSILMEQWKAKLQQETKEESLLVDTLSCIQQCFKLLRKFQILKELQSTLEKQKKEGEKEEEKEKEEEGKAEEKEGGITSKAEVRLLKNLKTIISTLPKVDDKETLKTFLNEQLELLTLYTGAEVLDVSFEAAQQLDIKIDEIVKQEYPTIVFNPVSETYEAGKQRVEGEITEFYKRSMEDTEKIKDLLLSNDVPMMEVNKKNENFLNEVYIALDSHKKRGGKRGEFAFTVTMETAEKLLEQGFYFLSKFGKWCPVQVYRMRNSIHMFLPLSSRGKINPIIYRNYIYFVGGENEKKNFIEDPIKYTFNEPHHPNIPLRIAVIGPPKSGKSILCKRLGLMFGLKVVTMGTALRFVVENMDDSLLKKTIEDYLRRGCFLPLSLKIEALMACLNDPLCVTQGFVFDGIPFDAAFTQSLAEKGKLPFVILSLVGEANYGKLNRERLDLTSFRLPYKQRVNLDIRYTKWKETYDRFIQWNRDTYNNVYEMKAKSNVSDIFYWAYDVIRKSYFGILYYVEYCVSDKVVPLQYLCISQQEFELRKSSYHNNCPVCWTELNKLICSSDPPPNSELFQYLNHFYWVCPTHVKNFTDRPKNYLPPKAPPCPEELPKIITKTKYEALNPRPQIHGFGRCTVTATDFPSSLDWEGSWDFAAIYRDKIFMFKNKEMLDRFLARPWRYYLTDTKFEVNAIEKSSAVEKLVPPPLADMPAVGFLEQTVADSIQQCLQVLASLRPIYPNLTPDCTACLFVALYLKANNQKRKATVIDKRCLASIFNKCRAFDYDVSYVRKVRTDESHVYFLSPPNSSSESSDTEFHIRGDEKGLDHQETGVLDLEAPADKKFWSAKFDNPELTKMKLTENDELEEIPEVPKIHVIVKYEKNHIRPMPLPPLINCLNFIYSRKKNLVFPEKFNYNSLHQGNPSDYPSMHQLRGFNPNKAFFWELYNQEVRSYGSHALGQEQERSTLDSSFEEVEIEKDFKFSTKHMRRLFMPRFHLFDAVRDVQPPPKPKVVDSKYLVFKPHFDYTYTLLYSNFFRMSHMLRCYEWDIFRRQLEYSEIYSRDLGLCNMELEFIRPPHVSPSMRTRRSIDSYQKAFDAACDFYVGASEPPSSSSSESAEGGSVNFIQALLDQKLKEIFEMLSSSDFSYDSYEVEVVSEEKTGPSTVIREILPYPPLIWDMMSRPYYSYCCAESLFEIPTAELIAHERVVSIMDGIREITGSFRFVHYPSWLLQKSQSVITHSIMKIQFKAPTPTHNYFFVYDFFNIPWTSFLICPFPLVYTDSEKLDVCKCVSESAVLSTTKNKYTKEKKIKYVT